MKRPCVFLVADGTMAQMLKSFLSRGSLEGRLGCRTFDFVSQDVVVDVKNGHTDGGIHRRAHALLHPSYRREYIGQRLSGPCVQPPCECFTPLVSRRGSMKLANLKNPVMAL